MIIHIGGRYEYDLTQSGGKERLYLGGDAYSAPMVLQRTGSGSWTAYNIGRDYLGNITQIASTGGTLVAEYGYDPWGRLRDPETLGIYSPGYEPNLFLGRGLHVLFPLPGQGSRFRPLAQFHGVLRGYAHQ